MFNKFIVINNNYLLHFHLLFTRLTDCKDQNLILVNRSLKCVNGNSLQKRLMVLLISDF